MLVCKLFRAGKHFKRQWCTKTAEVTVIGAIEVPKPDCTGFAVSVREGNRLHEEVSALATGATASPEAGRGVCAHTGCRQPRGAGRLPHRW